MSFYIVGLWGPFHFFPFSDPLKALSMLNFTMLPSKASSMQAFSIFLFWTTIQTFGLLDRINGNFSCSSISGNNFCGVEFLLWIFPAHQICWMLEVDDYILCGSYFGCCHKEILMICLLSFHLKFAYIVNKRASVKPSYLHMAGSLSLLQIGDCLKYISGVFLVHLLFIKRFWRDVLNFKVQNDFQTST